MKEDIYGQMSLNWSEFRLQTETLIPSSWLQEKSEFWDESSEFQRDPNLLQKKHLEIYF